MHKTKVVYLNFYSLHPKIVQSPLIIFWISGPFKYFLTRRILTSENITNKSESCRSIFCRIVVNFLKFNTGMCGQEPCVLLLLFLLLLLPLLLFLFLVSFLSCISYGSLVHWYLIRNLDFDNFWHFFDRPTDRQTDRHTEPRCRRREGVPSEANVSQF